MTLYFIVFGLITVVAIAAIIDSLMSVDLDEVAPEIYFDDTNNENGDHASP